MTIEIIAAPMPGGLTEDLAQEIAPLLQALPGSWLSFNHESCEGQAMLLIAPKAWEGSDTAFLIEPREAGVAVLFTDGDDCRCIGLAPTLWSAVLLAQRQAVHCSDSHEKAA